jgi:iron complex transport system permease protein
VSAVGIFLAVLFAMTALLSLATGAFRIPLGDLLRIIVDGPARDTVDSIAHDVFWQVRLPRVVLAVVVGASLAVAGVLMQGIFRNPLAEPATVGVSAGAAVGAVLAIIVGLNQLPLGVQVAAFLGGTLSTALVYVLSRTDGKTEVVTLILTGIAINAFAGAVIGFAVFVADDDEIRSVTFWSLGTLGLATWKAVGVVIPLAIVGLVASVGFSRVLDTLALGDRSASHLGIKVERVRLQAIAVVGLLASSAVAATGMIAFVGLLVPHIMRLVLGPRHRHLLWTSAVLGASVTLLADLAARTLLSPAELPLGVVTALIGAPFFLLLLRSTQRSRSAQRCRVARRCQPRSASRRTGGRARPKRCGQVDIAWCNRGRLSAFFWCGGNQRPQPRRLRAARVGAQSSRAAATNHHFVSVHRA